MSIPKQPHQQMIHLMYLVLTALLAMNIQAEILDVFYLVKEGIAISINSMDEKNSSTLEKITTQYRNNPEKVAEAYNKTKTVSTISNKLYVHFDEVKFKILNYEVVCIPKMLYEPFLKQNLRAKFNQDVKTISEKSKTRRDVFVQKNRSQEPEG